MIIPKELLEVVTLDPTRTNIGHVYIDVERKRAIATDGHRLVALTIDPEEGEASGYISKDAILHAAKHTRGQLFRSAYTTTVGGTVFANPYAEEEHPPRYPDWEAVVPTGKTYHVIGLDAA